MLFSFLSLLIYLSLGHGISKALDLIDDHQSQEASGSQSPVNPHLMSSIRFSEVAFEEDV